MLLSRVIKSHNTIPASEQSKTISIKKLFQEDGPAVEESEADNELIKQRSAAELEKEMEQKLSQAESKARQTVAEADDYAEQVRSQIEAERQQAEQQLQEAFEEARQQGYNAGFSEGQEAGRQTYDGFITEAQEIIASSQADYARTIESAEPVMIDLAVALAQRILGKKLEEDHENWAALLKQVMLEVREHEHVKIYVHPHWYTLTLQQKAELEQLLSHTEQLYIYPDSGLPENGCVVESKYGRIDATLDRQLEQLKVQLLEKWKEGPDERAGAD